MDTVKNTKIPFIISMTIIGVAMLGLIIAGLFAFVPVEIVKPNVQPYVIKTPIVKAGESVVYVADVCKFKEVTSIASRGFVDENDVHYPLVAVSSNVPAGCAKNSVSISIPLNMQPGKYYITLDIEYQVNPLRVQTYHFKTDTFTIIANPKLEV